MDSTGHPRNSFHSSSTHDRPPTSRTGRAAVGNLRFIMGWNGFAVMTLALGATTDATTDKWQTRKWHSSMTYLRYRHPRTPNSRWKKQPSDVLLTTTTTTAVPTSPPSLYNYRVVDLAGLCQLATAPQHRQFLSSSTLQTPTALSISTFVISPASSQHLTGLSARRAVLN